MSICAKKKSYRSEEAALAAIRRSGWHLLAYGCERCRLIHLTSRTKGKPCRKPPIDALPVV